MSRSTSSSWASADCARPRQLGLESIPAVVKNTADENMLRDALLENLHRANLNALEEASAYQQLLDDFGITQEQLAERIGRSRPQITNTIRLLKLPAVRAAARGGRRSQRRSRARHPRGGRRAAMERLSDKIVNEDLSVRQAEAAADAVRSEAEAQCRRQREAGRVTSTRSRSSSAIASTRASRSRWVPARDTIVIDFATVADLNRILAELGQRGFGAQ